MFRKALPYIWILICFSNCTALVHAQPLAGVYELRGRLVEVVEGKTVGVAGVTVSVPGQWQDKTAADGTFSLSVSKSERYVQLELNPLTYEFIFPDVINLPPPNTFVKVLVCCGEKSDNQFQNQLRQLDQKVEQTARQRKISQRQITQLKRQLIDTVLYYQTELYFNEQSILKLEAYLEATGAQNEALKDSLQNYRQQLSRANQQIATLSKELYAALEEKFLRQYGHYEQISGGLQNYLDRIKDLRDWLPRIEDYFRHPEAQKQFNAIVDAYSEAWRQLSTTHETDINAVFHYWEDPAVADCLRRLDDFILSDLHKQLMLAPFDEQVIRPMQQWASRQIALGPAKKKTANGATAILKQLNPMIDKLEQMMIEMEIRFNVDS